MKKLDMEERLRGAFTELIAADGDFAELVGTRIWMFGDASHKATYPCILFNTPDSAPSGLMEMGWYEIHLQILGAVFRPDDKDLSTLRTLEGLIRGFCQQADLPAQLTGTMYARRWSHPLTVVDARIENDVAEEDGSQSQIYSGTTLAVVCAPFNENEVRPQPSNPSPDEGGDDGQGEEGGAEETGGQGTIETTQENQQEGET